MFNQNISIFASEASHEAIATITLQDFLSGTRWKAEVQALRQLVGEHGLREAQLLPDYNEIVKQLPVASIGGVFRMRRDDACEKPSGFIALEFLAGQNGNPSNIQNIILTLRFRTEVACLLRNATGTGIIAVVRINCPESSFKRLAESLILSYATFGLRADAGCLHIANAIRVTFDDHAYINEQAQPFELTDKQMWIETLPSDDRENVNNNDNSNCRASVVNEETVQRIKESIDLADIVAENVNLKRSAGGRLVGCCPFHEEKTGSFTVYPDGHYYCFGCGKGGDVITYVQQRDNVSFAEAVRRLSERVAGLSDGDTKRYSRASILRQQRMQQEAPIEYINRSFVERSMLGTSVFTDFLHTLFNDKTVKNVTGRYLIGATRNRSTIFWQIDRAGRVHQGKIIPYMINGHRDKSKSTHIDSVAFRLHLKHFSQCLFGEEQLAQYPDRPIALVEAEKTAVICSAMLPDYTWLATGGKGNFKQKMLLPLRGRMVSVFPDYDAYDEWSQKSATIPGVTFIFSGLLRKIEFPDIEHADIADVLVSLIQRGLEPPQFGLSGDPIVDIDNLCKSIPRNLLSIIQI